MTRECLPWDRVPHIFALKKKLEKDLGQPFNYVLINLYENGEDNIGWHTDKEKDLVDGAIVASVSLGATRDFHFQRYEKSHSNRIGSIYQVALVDGSLLTMEKDTQKLLAHSLPVRKLVKTKRGNLTFRQMKVKGKEKSL